MKILSVCVQLRHQIDSCNIAWNKQKFAMLRYSNGSFAGTVSMNIFSTTTTTHRNLYRHEANGFMRVALRLKCQSDLVITSP